MNNTIEKNRNYWPHSIVAVLIFMVFACAMVVKLAMDNPVQMDNYYLEKYQQVDENINKIREKQKIFEENFTLDYKTKKFTMGISNSFEMSIINIKDKSIVKNADIRLVISRPDTNEFNQEIRLKSTKDGTYVFNGIKADKPGRWQVLTKIKIGEKSSFNKHEVYASN
ncbi:MAG: FixH family protein [Sulfurospirillum sp.]|nr:FixH family protein [Sulfurospirillum sp.]MBL0703286.1 FixH family protein [Sulfurospirillum sp.]